MKNVKVFKIVRDKYTKNTLSKWYSIPSAQPLKKIYVKAPYYSGLSECLSRQLTKFNIFLSHTSSRTLKSLILNYKPDVPPFDLVGIV